MSDDICDIFRGKGVLSDLDMLYSVRPGKTSGSFNKPQYINIISPL